jgi:hypothetical protein
VHNLSRPCNRAWHRSWRETTRRIGARPGAAKPATLRLCSGTRPTPVQNSSRFRSGAWHQPWLPGARRFQACPAREAVGFPTRDQAGHRHTKGGARPGVRVHHPRPLTRDEPEFDPETSPRRGFRCHPICTTPEQPSTSSPRARRRVAGRVLFASLHRCARGRGALSADLKRQKVMLLGCSCY